MLTLYGFDASANSNKVRYVIHALGLPHEYKVVNLRAGEQRTPEFLKINPVGRIPVIDDDGFVLFESNAIIKYLASKHKSSLYPNDLKKRAVIDQWIDFSSMHVGTALSKLYYNRVLAPMRKIEVDERSVKEGVEFLARFLPIVEAQLETNKFVAGNERSLADFVLLAALDPAEVSIHDLGGYKAVTAWRTAMKKEDFYRKCYNDFQDVFKR